MCYSEFVHKELIHFSIADNVRSIPSMVDGLKPGQRKILFSLFKRLPAGQRKLRQEIKVAQLSGYVAEHSAYHHGEMSLNMTIVNMAQDFVGSNNVNLLSPIGMFGTRALGGKEAASPRYIFTNLNDQTRLLYPEEDMPLMNYIVEEGLRIEPDHYVPIIPLVLVNGAEGIGTGWATVIPQFSPLDIISNLRSKLKHGASFVKMTPWYRGFTGKTVYSESNNSYVFHGTYKIRSDHALEITELPINKWTSDYKAFLEGMLKNEEIDDVKEYHKDNSISFVIKLPNLADIEKSEGGIEKKFKLTTNISMNNMVLFDS